MKINPRSFFYRTVTASSSGFTLMEIVVGGAILVGVGMAGAILFKNQMLIQSKINYDGALNTYHGAVLKLLNNSHHCNATMKPFYDAPTLGPANNLNSINLCANFCTLNTTANDVTPGAAFAQEGQYIDNKQVWMISDISILGPVVNDTGALNGRITYTLNPRLGNKITKKDLRINVKFNGGKFKECFSVEESNSSTLQKSICESLSDPLGAGNKIASWNSATDKCELLNVNISCPNVGDAISGVAQNGTVNCNTITNTPDPLTSTVADCSGGKKLIIQPRVVGSEMKLEATCL